MIDCQFCTTDNGHGDFMRLCCRVRFLLKLPSVELRRAWLERWEWQGNKAVEETKAAFAVEFRRRKNNEL